MKENKPEGTECSAHPKQECKAFCESCDIPICVLCVSIKHKTHEICELSEKIDTLSDFITKENERVQSIQSEIEKILNHIAKRSAALPNIYKQTRFHISAHAREWHQEIDKAETQLLKDLDVLQEKHAGILLKQRKELEETLKKLKILNQTDLSLAKSKDIFGLMELQLEFENQQLPTYIEETLPACFQPCLFDENFTTSHFGFINTLESQKLPIGDLTQEEKTSLRQALDVPTVLSVFDNRVPPANKENETRLYDLVPFDDDRVWVGGYSYELKLFDFQGRLHNTVPITDYGGYLSLHDGHAVYANRNDNTVKKFINGKEETLFCTKEWKPYGMTCTAALDFLVCLRTSDETESKVVRYSISCDVLQEIQYDSQYQPLFGKTNYVVENGNGDVCVADWDKKAITVVDKFGIFRFSYKGNKALKENIHGGSLTTDSMRHIIITDYLSNKIHMLDRDGLFLRYIIPDQGIRDPRAVCVVREGELMVGECNSGKVKRIKYLD
ncbi:uncharacterized protein LOC134263606 [Saccostrea cucullata]|uniref:uncharacterized protein LOC134263606 n=1 Tax=Saccostrea cuccullata TaxID=36930 RepID=UPI002ECFB92E